ncbi:MAG TPA: DUF167 domain-containing protein [Candidatus Aenigmarchaeota archaeon]|nr:DUF167 domain-containing protein [Candidatus Aenigmarchaeota archaeon]
MLISVKVVPNASRNRVLKDGEVYRVYVNSPAADGKANKALIDVLSEHFSVKKNTIRIVRGEKSKNKTVEIDY